MHEPGAGQTPHDLVTRERHQELRPVEGHGARMSQAEKLAGIEETSGWVYARGIVVFSDVLN